MFPSPVSLIVALLAAGVFFVLIPVASGVAKRFRCPLALRCPEDRQRTSVQVDATHAALTALVGSPSLRVQDCARWPRRQRCDRACLAQVHTDGTVSAEPAEKMRAA